MLYDVVDSFHGGVIMRLRLAPDSIIRRGRRHKSDRGETRDVSAQTDHLAHAFPGSIQHKDDQRLAARRQRESFIGWLGRKIYRVLSRIEQNGKCHRRMNLTIDPFIPGKVDSFDQQGVVQAKMSHSTGSKTMFSLSRLSQNHEAGPGIKWLDERTVTRLSRPAAGGARRPVFRLVGQPLQGLGPS